MTEKTLADVLIKRLLFNSQRWKMGKYLLPKFRYKQWHMEPPTYRGLTTSFYVRVEFANITVITERFRDNIEEMKENFARIHDKYVVGIEGKESWGFTPVPKYTHVSLFVTFNLRKLKQEG